MQVFKAYLKIINKMKGTLIIYAVIFLSISIINGGMSSSSDVDYTATKCKIALINYDIDSKLIAGLTEYLGEHNEIIQLNDEEEKLQNALFYREVEYIIKIPEGFTKDFMDGREALLIKRSIPDSLSSYYVESIINKYMNTAKIYIGASAGITEEELIELVKRDLKNTTDVIIKQDNHLSSIINSCNNFYNFSLYSIFVVLTLGASVVMFRFMEKNIKSRNNASPMRQRSFQVQMILGNLIYTLIVWVLISIVGIILFKEVMFSSSGMLLLLNSLICSVTALSISFFVSYIIKSEAAMSAAINLISLGSAFIGGAFVGQDLLSSGVLKAASFTPGYWFVKVNNNILQISNYRGEDLKTIFGGIGVQSGFAVMFFVITLVYAKYKRVGNE